MKNTLLLLLSIALLSFSFCKKKEEEKPQIKVDNLSLSPTVLELKGGEKKNLTLTFTPSNATNQSVQWSSDSPAVATVSNDGEVSALQSGTAVITATSGEDKSKTSSCTVKVLSAYISSITFTTSSGDHVFTLSPLMDNGTTTVNNAPSRFNRTELKATITMAAGASIKIENQPFRQGQAIDFRNPAGTLLVLTTQDGKQINYTIAFPSYSINSNPYGVYTAADLNAVRNCLTCHYKMMNNITLPARDAAGATATGISDYATAGWLPIAHDVPFDYVLKRTDGAFTGTFDGGNFVIDNFYINRSSSKFAGLFGFTYRATIKNLGVSGASPQAITGADYAGSITGYMMHGSITNCFSKVDVSSTSRAGGIIGEASGGTVSLCYATGNVSVSSGKAFAGGLIGYFFNNGPENAISKCYATGNVSASTSRSAAEAGGLVGGAEVPVSHCYATGNVFASGSSDYWAVAGGLLGFSSEDKSVSHCYATGNVSVNAIRAQGAQGTHVAGFSGKGSFKLFTKCVRNKEAVIKKNNVVVEADDAILTEIEGKTKKEMQEDSFTTYLNNGADVWERNNSKNNGMPTIKGL